MVWKVAFPVLAAVLAVGFGAMVGGWNDMEKDNAGALNALRSAVVDHNRKSNSVFRTEMSKVIKVQNQVVAGMKYRITATMGKTGCRKGGTEERCTVLEEAEPYNCTFVVWSKPWQNFVKVLSENCTTVQETI